MFHCIYLHQLFSTYPVLQIVNESDLKWDLQNGHDSVDDVKRLIMFGVFVVDAGDDGEDHVNEDEDGREVEQVHVQVHLDVDLPSGCVAKVQLLGFRYSNDQGYHAQNVDDDVSDLGP